MPFVLLFSRHTVRMPGSIRVRCRPTEGIDIFSAGQSFAIAGNPTINARKVEFMRKKVIRVPQIAPARDQCWMDMNKAASVEVSSEDENYPIESALLGDEKRGWRAAEPGSQTIRLIFDSPQRLRRIWLAFEDSEVSRTQEFVLRWSSHVGQPFREIVRQQWNFSPPGGVREIEDYAIDLVDVGVLELIIVPDKSGGEARASLAKMRLS
jgi:hypothetical protein